MIKYLETFDAISGRDGLIKNGWTTWCPPSSGYYFNSGFMSLGLVDGGRFGTKAMSFVTNQPAYYMSPPRLTRSANKMIIGVAARPTTYGVNWRAAFSFVYSYGTYSGDFQNIYENFYVVITFSTGGGCTISMRTGTSAGGYPAITAPPRASVPFATVAGAYTFIEVYVDVTDYVNGRCKVAINNRVAADVYPILTAAGNGFGNNPYDIRAKINQVNIAADNNYNNGYIMDSMYICDDEGSYHDDFLGDIFVKTIYPVADGFKSNWTPWINGTVEESATRAFMVDDVEFDATLEADYLQADQDLTEQYLRYLVTDIPNETIIGINQRTAMRAVGSVGTPLLSSLVPTFKSIGNSPIITNPARKRAATGWTYSCLDVYNGIVPGLAVPWTRLLLEESEFGFMLQDPIWSSVVLEELGIADEAFDTEYDWDLVQDEAVLADEAIDSIGLLMLFFAGVDEATIWVEDSHDYDPDYTDGAEIDTAQFYVGASSVKLVARDGQPSGFGYVVPGITPSITQTVFFRFHGIDDYLGIFLGDTDEGEVFFDFAIEARDGSRYYWIGAGNADGDIGIPYTGECLLAADTWQKVEMIVDGRDITVKVNGSEVVTWTAAADNPLSGLGYAEYQNANDVTGNDVWIGSAVIRE